MNVLPPFANRPDERDERALKERHRIEFENDLSKKRQIEVDIHDQESLDNQNDARAYANEQAKQEAIELINARKDAEFNRMQAEARKRQAKEEENKVEWWESKSQFNEHKHDRDRKHYADQLRRNETLKLVSSQSLILSNLDIMLSNWSSLKKSSNNKERPII